MDETEILPGPPPTTVYHRYALVNGVRLHYVEAMPHPATVKGKERVILALHGFPEFWYAWRHQIPALASAGFRALAPDLRGYNESDKPAGVASYRIEQLLADVAGLIRHAGERRAVVVGHDWGGALAWLMPLAYPEMVERLVVLNAPHPGAFQRELRTPAQLLRSWYIFFFQLPWLPEALLRARHFAGLERTLRTEPVRRDAFTDDDIERYKGALGQPGALTAALNWYRAAFRSGALLRRRDFPPIRVPALLFWGRRDRYLGLSLTKGLERWVPDLRIVHLPDASHWVQCDAAEQVNRLLIDFLREGRQEPVMSSLDVSPKHSLPPLNESDLDREPVRQFRVWLDQAVAAKLHLPEAMTLATATPDGRPAARMVLLRGLDERGFVFFTNYDSRKSEELEANPRAALLFYWPELERQVRIEGRVERVATEESDSYFAGRPYDSQLGAWASPQSQVIAERGVLERRMDELHAQYRGGPVPRPPHWGGFRVVPASVEFWQGRASRLHDRLRYARQDDGSWRVQRLAP